MAQNTQNYNHVFCLIVGGGMSGVTMGAHLIKMKVLKPWEFRIMDQNAAYGGVWVANHYPGAACDVPSHGYVMRYFLNPDWSKKYAPQAEIQQYYQKIGNYYGLPQSTSFSTKVVEARWNEKTLLWEVLTEDCISKKQSLWTANVVVNAGGQFYKPKGWDIPGMETFEGTEWHTAEWRHDFDLTGKRVAIIGTGPSTGQVAPSIQPLVKQLYVYQRSATYVVPRGDGPIPAWKRTLFSWFPPLLWMYHLWWYWSFETSKPMWLLGTQQNNGAAAYSHAFLEKQVESPEIREKLTPKDPFGCKRILVLDDYLTIFNKKNVELITEKPVRITKTGIVSDDGKEREVDVILNGTGFDTTRQGGHFQVYGVGGLNLAELWGETPSAYYSVGVSKFPNFMMMMGPNGANFWSCLPTIIQIQAQYNCKLVRHLKQQNQKAPYAIYVKEDVQKAYNDYIRDRKTQGPIAVLAPGCHNFYTNSKGEATFWNPLHGYVYGWRLRKPNFGDYTILQQPQVNGRK